MESRTATDIEWKDRRNRSNDRMEIGMGIFGKRRRNKNQKIEGPEQESAYSEALDLGTEKGKQKQRKNSGKTSIRFNTPAERMGYVKESCETVLECNRQIDEAKVEYQAVTSYLTDMQKIDMIQQERRENLEEAARKIITLSKERGKLQNKSSILSDRQYRLFERYELQIPKELPQIREGEAYQAVIQQDIMHLDKEREGLDVQQEDIISKQSFLKGIAIITGVIIMLLFCLFAILSNYSTASFTIPFLLTVLMGMVSTLYIFMEARKNMNNNSIVQAKQNRQILLMNKVKIKSVNNRNYLDYAYNKYMVENYAQLKAFWEEYIKRKDEARRYQSNTELLEFFHNELIQELKKFGVSDAEIWIYQPSAILDNKEMVEVRHRLNVRRQNLRERIDLNQRQMEEALNGVKQIISAYPDSKDEAEKMLRRYRIELQE